MASQPFALPNTGRDGCKWSVMSLVTVASNRLQLSPTPTRRRLPSFFFNAVSGALEIQAAMEPGMWPWKRMLTIPWRALTLSSLYPGMRHPLKPNGPLPRLARKNAELPRTRKSMELQPRRPGPLGAAPPGLVFHRRNWVTVVYLLGYLAREGGRPSLVRAVARSSGDWEGR